jgi:ketopantoate reductase
MPRILLIGAGAVGISYGQALQRAGSEVFYYVRAQYRDELKSGIHVHHLNRIPERRVELFKNFGLLSTLEEVRDRSWDQVWLCMSSTALKGDWLKPMLVAIGNATLVALQPGLNNESWLAARYPATKTCWGLITFIAWQSPLPGETLSPKGIALYHPPLSASPFSGHSQAEIVAELKRGGCPAKIGKDIGQAAVV